MFFLIGHILPVCSLFKNKSILKNLIQIDKEQLYIYSSFASAKHHF